MNPKKDTDFTVDTSSVGALLSGLSGRFDGQAKGQSDGDGTTAQRQDGTTADRPNGTTAPARPRRRKPEPEPEPEGPRSKYTLLLDQRDALALDQLALMLRRRLGRPVDKSEMLRALIRLTEKETDVYLALADALNRRKTPEA